tara:strand:- start:96 stop:452 length:357 start_codon:yes stop_codon:yes gene_type:complete
MTTTKQIGQVKWFNNKIGYGFIKLINSKDKKDIFVHHQNIKPLESNYRTLKTGEYVEFELDPNCEGNEHSEQATNVTGMCGLELQCDFIHRANKKRKNFKKTDEHEDHDEDMQEPHYE